MTYFARDFKDVDNSNDVQTFVQCLRLQQALESYKQYKQKTFERMHLKPGHSVLEVGCGTGEDTHSLAGQVGNRGKVTAVDRSETMLNQARDNCRDLTLPIDFVLADAQKLPFADNSFNAARVDRTLQHIFNPQNVLQEMVRVVQAEGWVVAVEPDWGTFVIDSDQRLLTRQLLDLWCDNFPAGWIGRRLFRYFCQLGLTEIEVEPINIEFTKFELADKVLGLSQTVDRAKESGMAAPETLNNWLDELQQFDQLEHFFCSFTLFMVSGKKSTVNL